MNFDSITIVNDTIFEVDNLKKKYEQEVIFMREHSQGSLASYEKISTLTIFLGLITLIHQWFTTGGYHSHIPIFFVFAIALLASLFPLEKFALGVSMTLTSFLIIILIEAFVPGFSSTNQHETTFIFIINFSVLFSLDADLRVPTPINKNNMQTPLTNDVFKK